MLPDVAPRWSVSVRLFWILSCKKQPNDTTTNLELLYQGEMLCVASRTPLQQKKGGCAKGHLWSISLLVLISCVHHRVPATFNLPLPVYIPEWRKALWEQSILPKTTTQFPWRESPRLPRFMSTPKYTAKQILHLIVRKSNSYIILDCPWKIMD